jgi:CBS domain-containing protein
MTSEGNDAPLHIATDQLLPVPRMPLLVRDLMSHDPVSVEPTATVKDIAHILLERQIRCVPVIDIGEKLVGVVSEADLISREGYPTLRTHHLGEFIQDEWTEHRHHWAARAQGLTAGEIMTHEVITCRPDETVTIVTRRMLRDDVRTVPVVDDDGRLVGMLSRSDVLRLFDRPDAEIREGVKRVLIDPLWAPSDHDAHATVRDGVVILEGSARCEADVNVLVAAVRQVPGVTEVVNRLSAPTQARGPVHVHGDYRG